jgi:carboxymethylenebutenolidase
MTELQRYLAEEVAEDHADGILTRREAVRRLGLLGLSTAAATTMLTDYASGARRAAAAQSSKPKTTAFSAFWAPVVTQPITFPGPQGRTLMGAWAPAAKPRGGVLVIHENRGLTDHIKTVAGRFAASGWSALAIDLLSEEGGTGAFADEGQASAALAGVPPERFDADMQAGVSEIIRRVPRKRVAATGFCFGGGMVWRLLAAKEKRLAAAAPFYGPWPDGADLRGIKAATIAIYAGDDTRVNAGRDTAAAALRAAGVSHQIVTFGGANHAFFNDTGQRFHAPSAAEAYRRVLLWFEEYARVKKKVA